MKNQQYFEGYLQLRNPTKELINFVKADIKKNKGVWIAKQVKHKTGFDYYLNNNKYLLNLGRRLQKRFNGELKTSRKLFSMSRLTSKRIYRVTVLFKLHDFKIGDIVKVGKRQVKIKVLGKKVFGVDVDSGKKVSFKYDEVN